MLRAKSFLKKKVPCNIVIVTFYYLLFTIYFEKKIQIIKSMPTKNNREYI
jgi:hypothetical protein